MSEIEVFGVRFYFNDWLATGSAAFGLVFVLLVLGWSALKFCNAQVKPRKKQ